MARPCLLLALALIVGAAGHRGGAVRRAQPAVRAVRRTAFAPRTAPALSADTLVGSEQEMISITPPAMKQLLALKAAADGADLVLRMGVRSGGCSGMSYVMDMIDAAAIDATDLVIEYGEVGLRCVIDAKSSMFLYGLQLDYSDKLIGGGFGFSVRARAGAGPLRPHAPSETTRAARKLPRSPRTRSAHRADAACPPRRRPLAQNPNAESTCGCGSSFSV
jgi:iron-sulfur cluster assembly accessory protein